MDEDKIRELEAEKADLISQLTSPYSDIGDWKLNKQEEAAMLGKPAPYTEAQMQEYGAKRATVRARINEIEQELQS